MRSILREFWLLSRDRAALLWLILALLLSALAVVSGILEVRAQRATIAALAQADQDERTAVTAGQSDWGGVAYYSFHLTYSPPPAFAFAAVGQRDVAPWMHRVRMLALEGQIHESDAAHPELALVGRFDFAFVAALLAPLLLLLLLHDLRAGEHAAGRYELLCASVGEARTLWRTRAALRSAMLAIALLVPLGAGYLVEGGPVRTLLLATAVVAVHLLFWHLICGVLDKRPWTGSVKLTSLIGAWLLLAVLLPAAFTPAIERIHPVPSGADILLTQREAVNSAWDLPKEETMAAFLARHPKWQEHAEIVQPFEWKWYYAFQQVGDQEAEPLSQAYREGQLARDRLAARLSWLSPPSWTQRQLQSLAGTDTRAMLAYDQAVRDFHATLRDYYYPRLFLDAPLDSDSLSERPAFRPSETSAPD